MISAVAAPPDRRQYVEYPTHIVMSKIVKWFSRSAKISKVFVFTENDLNDGTGAYAVGMDNVFHACYKWERDETILYPIGPETLESFPYSNCYLRCNWDLFVCVSMFTNRELAWSFVTQNTSKNIHLFLSNIYKRDYVIVTRLGHFFERICQLMT
jgi:hypothetical protein